MFVYLQEISLNHFLNNFLWGMPTSELSLFKSILHTNMRLNFLNIETEIYFYSMCFSEFPFYSLFSINPLLGIKGFHNKPQLLLLALSTTLPCSRQTEPLIVGLRFPPLKLFFLLPSLGIVSRLCSSTYENSILAFRPISRVTWH